MVQVKIHKLIIFTWNIQIAVCLIIEAKSFGFHVKKKKKRAKKKTDNSLKKLHSLMIVVSSLT